MASKRNELRTHPPNCHTFSVNLVGMAILLSAFIQFLTLVLTIDQQFCNKIPKLAHWNTL